MKTLKLRVNTGTDHYEKELGPPIPHSFWLWGVWGCYTHENCVATTNPVTNITDHWNPQRYLEEEHNYCVGAAKGCEYWIHWLVGELEEPGKGYSTGDKWE